MENVYIFIWSISIVAIIFNLPQNEDDDIVLRLIHESHVFLYHYEAREFLESADWFLVVFYLVSYFFADVVWRHFFIYL